MDMTDNLRMIRLRKIALSSAVAVFFLSLFILSFNLKMYYLLNHDEHQFISSGALLAHKMFLPYKDYAYYHTPNLIFIYALIFRCTGHLLFAVRTFSVSCSIICTALIFYVAFNLFCSYGYAKRFFIAAGSALILFTNPIFTRTTGLAWNHDFSVLLAMVACLVHCHAATREKAEVHVFLSGALAGLAIGTRLSFILMLAPFLFSIFLFPLVNTNRVKMRLLFFCIAGFCIAMLPTFILFIIFPEKFLHGIVQYRIITPYGIGLPHKETITLEGKIHYFLDSILFVPGNMIIFLAFAYFVIFKIMIQERAAVSGEFEAYFMSAVAISLLIFSFLSRPSWTQYFYAPIPFFILAVLYAVAKLRDKGYNMNVMLVIFIIFWLVFSITCGSDYGMGHLKQKKPYIPVQTHRIGKEIARLMPRGGRVLTLAPIYPLEGGLDIYEEFATGPFMWRTAYLVDKKDRQKFKLVSQEDLKGLLNIRRPDAILTGFEEGLEEPLVSYAKDNGYKLIYILPEGDLWLPPAKN